MKGILNGKYQKKNSSQSPCYKDPNTKVNIIETKNQSFKEETTEIDIVEIVAT